MSIFSLHSRNACGNRVDMNKKLADERLRDLREGLPELKRRLSKHVHAAVGLAVQIRQARNNTEGRASRAADPRGAYGKEAKRS